MTAFDYRDCPYPVRASMAEGYRASWDYISKPGNWWSGAERVAIAQATRDARRCNLCAERKGALSPYGVGGTHSSSPDRPVLLSDKAIDAVHRIATDAARLTKTWIDETINDSFTHGHYVEAVSVVVAVFCIDSFHHALGQSLGRLWIRECAQHGDHLTQLTQFVLTRAGISRLPAQIRFSAGGRSAFCLPLSGVGHGSSPVDSLRTSSLKLSRSAFLAR